MDTSASPRGGSAWIRRFRPAPAAASRLVCLPFAGGSAGYFMPYARALEPGVDVLAVQYPGRQDRIGEAVIDDAHELADRVAQEVLRWADRPLTLFGHSLGGTVAFEVGLRLERAGVRPLGVVVSGRRAAGVHREEDLHRAPTERFVAQVRRLGSADSAALDDPELLEMALPILRGDYRAAETYRCRPQASLACPLLVLTGDDDPRVTAEEAVAWSAHTTAGFELRTYPGGHFFLTEHADEVIATVGELIERRLAARAAG